MSHTCMRLHPQQHCDCSETEARRPFLPPQKELQPAEPLATTTGITLRRPITSSTEHRSVGCNLPTHHQMVRVLLSQWVRDDTRFPAAASGSCRTAARRSTRCWWWRGRPGWDQWSPTPEGSARHATTAAAQTLHHTQEIISQMLAFIVSAVAKIILTGLSDLCSTWGRSASGRRRP